MSKKKILIVDDEPDIIELVKDTLFADDYEFFQAPNGKEGLALAKEKQPDLILLDVMMPEMDGYETCRRLRADSETKHIVVAMLSAKKEDHDILTGVDVGAIAYITKPFNPYDLSEKIKELLDI